MADDTANLLGAQNRRESGPRTNDPLYRESGQSSTVKYMQYAFIAIGVIMVVISVILSVYRTFSAPGGGLYFLLGISLVGFVVIQLLVMTFIKKSDLPSEKSWFLYLNGTCIILESIFTNVLLFQ